MAAPALIAVFMQSGQRKLRLSLIRSCVAASSSMSALAATCQTMKLSLYSSTAKHPLDHL